MSKDHILLFSVATTTLLVGAILLSTNVTADTDVIDTMTLGVPQSCTMSGTGMNSHTASVENGIYTPDIGTTTLHAFCNDNAGFAVYAVGYTDNEFGKNVLTDSTLGNTYDIATGTATSGSTSNWAMKLAITQDSGDTTGTNAFALDNSFGSYQSVPAAYTKVAHKDTVTDMTATTGGVKLTTTYAVLISANQPAGTYLGQVKYTLVHPASEELLQPQTTTPGYIAYYPNASTAVGSMGTTTGGPVQQLTASQTSATLLASNFSRAGYGFAGWNDAYDYSGNYYGPNEDITFTAGQYSGDNNGLSLYAVWVKSAGTFQSDAVSVCNSLTQAPASGTPTMASVSALTDERDNQTYAIAKLADGNCWMIENLRLESEDTISAEDEALSQGYGKYSGTGTDYGDFIGLADAESTGFSSTYSANGLYSNDGSNDTENIGTSNYPAYRMPRYNHINTDSTSASPTRATSLTASTSYTTTASANIYSYGNYYTWAAAMANTIYYSGPTATDADGKTSETVGTSLCPSGWKLPYGRSTGNGSTTGGFSYLDTQLGGTGAGSDSSTTPTGDAMSKAWRAFPNNFLYSGYFNTSSASNRGSYGYYWSSTVISGGNSYYLILSSSNVYPGTNGGDKSIGRSIRCVSGS